MKAYRFELFRKWIGERGRWGYSGIVVTNLFAIRATDPRALIKVSPAVAIGEGNDNSIREHATKTRLIVLAWGDMGELWGRDREVLKLVQELNPHCIGVTKRLNPLHPVRSAYVLTPQVYPLRSFRGTA
jgi:hypothetical protein